MAPRRRVVLSDDEEDEVTGPKSPGPGPVINDDASRDEILAAARTLQAQNNQLREQHARDEREREEASEESSRGPRRGKEKEESNPAARVANHARKYVLTKGIWLQTKGVIERKFDDAFDPADADTRFASTRNIAQGQLHDILEVLPEEYRDLDMRKQSWLQSAFTYGLYSQRGNTNTRLRQTCFEDILGSENKDVKPKHKADTRHDRFLEDMGWDEDMRLDDEGTRGPGYNAMKARIIHAVKDDGTMDNTTIFRNEKLFFIYAALTRGAGGLEAFKNGTIYSGGGGECMESKHNLKHDGIQPGAIAACGTWAIWLVSKDEKVKPEGALSGINYRDIFNTYLEFILSGLQKRKRAVRELMDLWNRKFYPGFQSRPRDRAAREGSPTSSARRLGQSWLDDDEEEPPTDEEANGSFTPPREASPSRQRSSGSAGHASSPGPSSRASQQPSAGPSSRTRRAGNQGRPRTKRRKVMGQFTYEENGVTKTQTRETSIEVPASEEEGDEE
ncbi:unnamed protein product [Peniophora sp. CBMAI 1063]|nr:unnamed protein product [Peniophora sp. CBMAI 1063]